MNESVSGNAKDLILKLQKKIHIELSALSGDCSSGRKLALEEINALFEQYEGRRIELESKIRNTMKMSGRVSALKFEYYTIFKDNQKLALNLRGALAGYTLDHMNESEMLLTEDQRQMVDGIIERYIFGNREAYQ